MPKHEEIRHLAYKPEQMFDLVADVDCYPDFLPWCKGARVRSQSETLVIADLIIGFKSFTEKFTSQVTLDKANNRIDVIYKDGPFKYLENHWIFTPESEGCRIDFYVDFEFKSKILQIMIGMVFNEAVIKMVNAFETRAFDLYQK